MHLLKGWRGGEESRLKGWGGGSVVVGTTICANL